jgi:hypothetical protein
MEEKNLHSKAGSTRAKKSDCRSYKHVVEVGNSSKPHNVANNSRFFSGIQKGCHAER